MLCTFWRCLRSRPGLAAASKTALFRCVCCLLSHVPVSCVCVVNVYPVAIFPSTVILLFFCYIK